MKEIDGIGAVAKRRNGASRGVTLEPNPTGTRGWAP